MIQNLDNLFFTFRDYDSEIESKIRSLDVCNKKLFKSLENFLNQKFDFNLTMIFSTIIDEICKYGPIMVHSFSCQALLTLISTLFSTSVIFCLFFKNLELLIA